MERKLASIQRITALDPIPGRDRIELATVLGWRVVVGKGEHHVGELVVYCEPDALLPVRPEFEFLRARCYTAKQNGFRIKTMKLGEVFSQGIVFGLEVLREFKTSAEVFEGEDVTEILGVRKWLSPEEIEVVAAPPPRRFEKLPTFLRKALWRLGFGRKRRNPKSFPDGIYKTDETRLQAMPEILDHMRGLALYATEKLDGCSATYFARRLPRHWLLELVLGKRYEFGVCSRNLRVYEGNPVRARQSDGTALPGNSYWEMAHKYHLPEKLLGFAREFEVDIAVQGEIVGPGIQGNHYQLPDRQLYVYQVQYIRGGNYLSWPETKMFCGMLDLNLVPEVDLPYDYYPSWGVDEWLTYAQSATVVGDTKSPREGVVVRTKEDRRGTKLPTVANRLSFKAVNREYLVKYDQ